MRILAVADAQSKAFDGPFDAEHWRTKGIQLIVGCGDLSASYLEFLTDLVRAPLIYVRGNHDDNWTKLPAGEDIDGRVVEYQGIRFVGFEGSPSYNGGQHQYGERAMAWKLATLQPRVWLTGRIDVVVAHASPIFCPRAYKLCPKPVGVGRPCAYALVDEFNKPKVCQDADDYAHRGFETFRDLIHRFHPRFFIHGHRHQTYGIGKRELRIEDTRVVDAYGHVILDL
jgi:Icc-related predicted phosphoesterase